jgi:2,4-dienoyl-CoA reductase-like NADH-dependent reductase (Old Yellow Enzyme family)
LAEVRRRVGAEYPVFVRLGVHDETPGGLELEDSCQVGIWLEEGGVNLIDVSAGLQGSGGMGKSPGYFVEYAEAMKARVNIPVLVAGGIRDPLFADQLIREGRVDLIGIGRAMLEDPEWARKAIEALS